MRILNSYRTSYDGSMLPVIGPVLAYDSAGNRGARIYTVQGERNSLARRESDLASMRLDER
jgi:hypothetical protein